MKQVFVTGATGFIGQHLVALLLKEGWHVVALTHGDASFGFDFPPQVRVVQADITDYAAVSQIMRANPPHRIYHLAGIVRGSDLSALWHVNVQGTNVLLAAASQLSHPPRVIIPGSAAEYGLAATAEPVTEQTAPRPLSLYGVSKVAQTLLALGYAWRGQLPVIVGRVFNITGHGEPATMLGGSMASQIAAIERGEEEPILSIGNLTPTRDYVDVQDMVQALYVLAEQGRAGEIYNICSGVSVQVVAFVNRLIAMSHVSITLQSDPSRQRPSDIPYCVGDGTKLHRETGWHPTIPFDESLQTLLDSWRGKIN